jgi:hypothetical protein
LTYINNIPIFKPISKTIKQNNMKKIIIPVFSLAMVLTMAYSCKKAVAYDDLPTVDKDTDTTLANANAVSQQYQQVFTVVHTEVSNVEDQAFKMEGDYAHNPNCTVTIDAIDSNLIDGKYVKYAKQVTLNFPEQYKDTKYLDHTCYGTIVITKTGRMDAKGTVCTINIDNLIQDNCYIGGVLVLENKGFVNGVYNLTLNLSSQGQYNYMKNVNLSYTIAASISNKIYTASVTGSQYFDYFGGGSSTVTSQITSPLIFSSDCNYIKKGAVKVTTSTWTSDQATITDYGDGTCDDKSTVIQNKVTYKYPMSIF